MGQCRPRTEHVLNTKDRRCPKCGCKLNNQRTRCKRCAQATPLPKKRKNS